MFLKRNIMVGTFLYIKNPEVYQSIFSFCKHIKISKYIYILQQNIFSHRNNFGPAFDSRICLFTFH